MCFRNCAQQNLLRCRTHRWIQTWEEEKLLQQRLRNRKHLQRERRLKRSNSSNKGRWLGQWAVGDDGLWLLSFLATLYCQNWLHDPLPPVQVVTCDTCIPSLLFYSVNSTFGNIVHTHHVSTMKRIGWHQAFLSDILFLCLHLLMLALHEWKMRDQCYVHFTQSTCSKDGLTDSLKLRRKVSLNQVQNIPFIRLLKPLI